MSEEQGTVRVSDADREAVAARLNAACGEGRLGLDELGERLERAYAARTREELDGVVTDLPAAAPDLTKPAASPARKGRTSWLVSPFGGLRRRGRWRLAQRTVALMLIGGMRLDLREAELEAPEVSLTAIALVGGVRVEVPPELRVEVSGFSVVGGRRVDTDERLGRDAPTLRVRAFSLIGGVRVQSRPRRRRNPRAGSGAA